MFGILLGANAPSAFADVYRALLNASFIFADEPSVYLWLENHDEVLACYSDPDPDTCLANLDAHYDQGLGISEPPPKKPRKDALVEWK